MEHVTRMWDNGAFMHLYIAGTDKAGTSTSYRVATQPGIRKKIGEFHRGLKNQENLRELKRNLVKLTIFFHLRENNFI